jgi:hypothetical protein
MFLDRIASGDYFAQGAYFWGDHERSGLPLKCYFQLVRSH